MNLPALASRSAFSVPYVDSELPCTEPRARNELVHPPANPGWSGIAGQTPSTQTIPSACSSS